MSWCSDLGELRRSCLAGACRSSPHLEPSDRAGGVCGGEPAVAGTCNSSCLESSFQRQGLREIGPRHCQGSRLRLMEHWRGSHSGSAPAVCHPADSSHAGLGFCCLALRRVRCPSGHCDQRPCGRWSNETGLSHGALWRPGAAHRLLHGQWPGWRNAVRSRTACGRGSLLCNGAQHPNRPCSWRRRRGFTPVASHFESSAGCGTGMVFGGDSAPGGAIARACHRAGSPGRTHGTAREESLAHAASKKVPSGRY
mmetsp:Transcript_16679/g.36547  ORF Transcript_16679/g.36547 Transcript_16679/m.36547 type:complete len:253 (+) Transcript_16679:1162-1920(+)